MFSYNRLILLCLSIFVSLRAFNFVIYLFIHSFFFLRKSILSHNAILKKTIMLTYLKLGGGRREPVRIKPLGSAFVLCQRFLKKLEISTRSL